MSLSPTFTRFSIVALLLSLPSSNNNSNGIFLARAQDKENKSVKLPTVQLYFQCGDDNNDSTEDLDDIDWSNAVRGFYESLLIDSQAIEISNRFRVDDQDCIDNDERQFRITARGSVIFGGSGVPAVAAASTTQSSVRPGGIRMRDFWVAQ